MSLARISLGVLYVIMKSGNRYSMIDNGGAFNAFSPF